MSNLKEIRNRISSISSTMKITNAMKMVSLAKLKKTKKITFEVCYYFKNMKNIFQKFILSQSKHNFLKNIFYKNNSNTILLVVICANKGLCGSFNLLILKKINKLVSSKFYNKKIQILLIGNKLFNNIKKLYNIFQNIIFADEIDINKISKIIKEISKHYFNNDFSEVILIYTNFKNSLNQNVVVKNLLPFDFLLSNHSTNHHIDYIVEPTNEKILKELIFNTLKINLYQALLNSLSSEHSSRIKTMHQATENAKKIKNELLLTYNKIRQQTITNEILEIVSGSEILN